MERRILKEKAAELKAVYKAVKLKLLTRLVILLLQYRDHSSTSRARYPRPGSHRANRARSFDAGLRNCLLVNRTLALAAHSSIAVQAVWSIFLMALRLLDFIYT